MGRYKKGKSMDEAKAADIPLDQLPEDLPELTHKQMQYVLKRHEGLEAAEAYRRAYNAEGMKPETIYVECWHLNRNPKVSQWLDALRMMHFKAAHYTKEEHIKQLLQIAEHAKEQGQLGATVQALTNAGKAAGHYTEKVEVMGGGDQDLPTLYARLKRSLGPQAAQAFFEQRGWALPDTTSGDEAVH